jgi:hypothetical protein
MHNALQVNELSNKQLSHKLKSLGYDIGPITSDTRSVYEKKLHRHFLIGVEPGGKKSKSTATFSDFTVKKSQHTELSWALEASARFLDDDEYEQLLINIAKKATVANTNLRANQHIENTLGGQLNKLFFKNYSLRIILSVFGIVFVIVFCLFVYLMDESSQTYPII